LEVRELLTQKRTKGPDKVKSLENLTLAQVYPRVSGDTNLNCCGDPDCGNHGIGPAPTKHSFLGRGAAERRLKAALDDPSIARGVGRYKMQTEGRGATAAETCPRSPRSSPIAVRRCGSALQAAVMVSIVGAPSRAGLPGTNARKGGLEF
jgi:hypothetical protein